MKAYIKALLYRDEFLGTPRLDIEQELMFQKIDDSCGSEGNYITSEEKTNSMEINEFWLQMENDYYEFLYLSNSSN